MKKVIAAFVLLFLVSSIYALPFSHYTSDYLRLRSASNLNSKIVTVLEPNLGVEVIEKGGIETIDGITADWVKVISANGYVGWCFSGYLTPLEVNVADKLAEEVEKIKAGAYPKQTNSGSQLINIQSISELSSKVGYYIQQKNRRFQGSGRAPEILQLVIINNKVIIREIDIIKNSIQILREVEFTFNGKTYTYNRSNIKKDENDQLIIYYLENKPEKNWLGTYEYRNPYTIVSGVDSAKLINQTSDILKNYIGTYKYDSCKVIKCENTNVNMESIKNAQVNIYYNESRKCLSVDCHDVIDINEPNNGVGKWVLDFIETSSNEPFFWTYGEGAGYSEEKFWFYKGGIAISYEKERYVFDDDHSIEKRKYQKYVIFLRKEK